MDFLLPVDAGLRLVALIQDAIAIEPEFSQRKMYRLMTETIEIGMDIIKPSQVLPAPDMPLKIADPD